MKKLMEKYGKKKVYIASILSLVLIIGLCTGGTVVYANNKKQAILDSIYINFKQAPIIEYGTETVDYQSFIESSVGEVTLPTETIDTKEVGSKELVYKVSKEGYEKEQKLTVEVKDTQFPTITLKGETVIVEVGSEFDVKSNIESVVDVVDGAIEEYEVTHNIDINVAGEYTVTIKATDKNGNVTEKVYTVVVTEDVEKTVNERGNSGLSYVGGSNSNSIVPSYNGGGTSSSNVNNSTTNNNTNNSNNGNNNSNSNNGNNNDIPIHEQLGYYPNHIGNSGRVFTSWEEADAWAYREIYDENSPYYMMSYACVSIGIPGRDFDFWTVGFR